MLDEEDLSTAPVASSSSFQSDREVLLHQPDVHGRLLQAEARQCVLDIFAMIDAMASDAAPAKQRKYVKMLKKLLRLARGESSTSLSLWAWAEIGQTELRQSRYTEALEALKMARCLAYEYDNHNQFSVRCARIDLGMADCYLALEKYRKAQDIASRFRMLAHGAPYLAHMYGNARRIELTIKLRTAGGGAGGVSVGELDQAMYVFDRDPSTPPLHKLKLMHLAREIFISERHSDYRMVLAQLQKRIVHLTTSALHPHHPDVGVALFDLATALHDLGRTDDALHHAQRAILVFESSMGLDSPERKRALDTVERWLGSSYSDDDGSLDGALDDNLSDDAVCVICMAAPPTYGFLHEDSVHQALCVQCVDQAGARTDICYICQRQHERIVKVFC